MLQAIRPFNTDKRERVVGRIEGRKKTLIRETGMIFPHLNKLYFRYIVVHYCLISGAPK